MNTEIRLWHIANNKIAPVAETSMAAERLERDLEDWIIQSPELLGEELLIIGRQHSVSGVGKLDLLAVDRRGELSVVELKRDLGPREVIAQALDYASWLNGISESDVFEIAEAYLKKPLEEAFGERFNTTELPSISPQNHRIIIVAARLDASAERIINYLAQRYSININAVFFRYAKLPSGEELVARSVLVAQSVIEAGSVAAKKPTASELVKIAADRKVGDIVARLRALVSEEYVWEEPAPTYGGSFRLWRKTSEGAYRMVLGLNVSGVRRNTPSGQLDVWIPKAKLGQVLGSSANEVREILKGPLVLEPDAPDNHDDCILRLKSGGDADYLVQLLKKQFDH